MGEYTRTYTVTGYPNSNNPRTVPFSKFSAEGDFTHEMKQILKIEYRHWHTSTNAPVWALRGQLVLADGRTFESDTHSHAFNHDEYEYVNYFTGSQLPTPAEFETLEHVRTLNSAGNYIGSDGYGGSLYWRATPYQPIQLIVYFSDEPPVSQSTIGSVTSEITVDGSAAIRVDISKSSTQGWHKVTWQFGSYSYTMGGVTADYVSYAIPLEWLRAIPSSMSGVGSVTLITYADAGMTEQVGEAASANFTLKVPESARPEVYAGWASAAPYNTGQAAGFATYIQGYSRVKVSFNAVQISLKYGATIAGYSYTVQNATVTAADMISGLLNQSGSTRIVCTVRDSRGLTNNVSLDAAAITINVLPYSQPKISSWVLLRSDNYGPPNDAQHGDRGGAYLYAMATGEVAASVGMASLTLLYKPRSQNSYTSVAMSNGAAAIVSGLAANQNYDAVIAVTDGLGNTYSVSAVLLREQKTFKMKEGGRSIGIGAQYGEDDTLVLGWKLILEQGLESYVPVTPVGGCMILGSGYDPATIMGGVWKQISWSGAPDGVVLWQRTS